MKIGEALGEDAAFEIKKIYNFFDEKMLVWLAGLYDPASGGFYFSNSARDYEGFLPDIESTAQALLFIADNVCQGELAPSIKRIPERFLSKACGFITELQDEDGFFYHPQWGKNVPATRRGRDIGWARRIVLESGGKYKYPSPYDKASRGGSVSKALPEYLSSIEAYRAWLAGKNLATNSYSIGHHFNSTSTQIVTAGEEFVAETLKWFSENQNPENGLWEKEVTYSSVSGLMKIATTYPAFGGKFNYAEKAFESAEKALLSDEPVEYSCQFYNAWCSMSQIIKLLLDSGETERAEALRSGLNERSAELIKKTGEKMALARCDDGSFAYFTKSSGKYCTTSQGVPVSLKVREGDVNGNGCSTSAPLKNMFKALGVNMPRFYTEADAELLFELMDARVSVEKLPLPRT